MSIKKETEEQQKKTDYVAENETSGTTTTESSEGNDSGKQDFSNESSEETTSTAKLRVHNLIILDQSGSMQYIYRPTLAGVNETLQTIRQAQKEHPEQEHFVSLIAFNATDPRGGINYNKIYNITPADKAEDITEEHYLPCGSTPLYDAMGHAITELRNHVDKNDVVLVTIITDGYENSSREYNGNAIKALVEEMKSQNWVFTYIGANQDVDAVASSMSIDNHLSFEADYNGASNMFEKEIRCRTRFFKSICTGTIKYCRNDYFKEDDDEFKKDDDATGVKPLDSECDFSW